MKTRILFKGPAKKQRRVLISIGWVLVLLFQGTFQSKANVELAPSLLIDMEVSNANPIPGETIIFTIRYRCGSLTEHCYNTKIVSALPAEMELIQQTLPGGNVSLVSVVGNAVSFNLSSPGSPAGQLDAGTTGLVKIWSRFPNCGPSTPPVGTNTATISASGAPTSSSNISITQNGSTPVCDTPPSGSISGGLEKDFDQDDVNITGNVEWEFYFPQTPIGQTREYIDTLPAKGVVHHVYAPTGVSIEIECNNSGIWRNPCNSSWLFWWGDTFFPAEGGQHQGGPSGCTQTYSECYMALHDGEARHYLYNITKVKFIVDENYDPTNPDADEAQIHMMFLEENPFTSGQLSSWEQPLPGDDVINCISGNGLEACNTAEVYSEGVFLQNDLRAYQTPWVSAPIPEAMGGIDPAWEDLLTDNPSALDDTDDNAIVFCLRFRVHKNGGDIENFVVSHLLDPKLDFNPERDSFWIIHSNKTNVPDQVEAHSQPGCNKPEFEVIPNFHNGRTLIRWIFDDCRIPGGYYINSDSYIYYSATVSPGATGIIENVALTTGTGQDLLSNPAVCCNRLTSTEAYWPTDYDHLDTDSDGITSEDILISTYLPITIQSLADVTSSKWIKGKLDTDFSRYPIAGDTDTTGAAEYQMLLTNTGNLDITQLDIIDILPHLNDQAILPSLGQARLSEWNVQLNGPILLEKWNSSTQAWEDASSDITKGPYYSTSLDPCRFENAVSNNKDLTVDETVAIGPSATCDTNPWTTHIATPSNARSFGLRYAPLAFAPGDSIRLTVSVKLYGNPPGCSSNPCGSGETVDNKAIAWNSFAFGAIYDDGGSGARLLDSEPIKVGLQLIDTDNYTSIGNYIWNDVNANGIQDITEPGIAGVTVSLWDAVEDTLILQSLTDSAGFYRFDGVKPDTTYKIRLAKGDDFTTGALKGYGLTGKDDPDNLGAGDDSDDSDADYNANDIPEITASVGNVTGIEDSNDPAEYATFDFGFFQTNTVGNFSWYDLDGYGDQSLGEPGVYNMKLTLFNTGADQQIGGGDDILWAVQYTDTSGFYLFEQVPNGIYYIQADKSTLQGIDPVTETTVLPSDWIITLSNTTGNDGDDSDANSSTGNTHTFQLTGNTLLNVDVGLKSAPVNPATIQGVVWNDQNSDGQRSGEPLLAGVEVKLLDNKGLQLLATETAGDGSYIFSNLPPSETYQVIFNINATSNFTLKDQGSDLSDSDANVTNGEAPAVSPTNNETISNIDAGVLIPPLIGDIVWQDLNENGLQDAGEPGIPGVRIDLYDVTGAEIIGSALTDQNGYFSFGGYHNTNMLPIDSTISITNNFFLDHDGECDAEENLPGSTGTVGAVDRWSSDLEFGNDGSDIQLVGVRFPQVTLSSDATVTNAYIQFTADEASSGAVTFSIKGEKKGHSPIFATTDYNLSNRTTTSSSVDWSPADWTIVNERGTNQQTAEVKSILAEIISQNDWASGNAITFLFERTSGTAKRVADSYYDPPKAAEMLVTYDTPVENERPLLASHSYEIRMNMTQTAISDNLLTSQNAGADDKDSDASLNGTTATVAFISPEEGNENFDFDIGMIIDNTSLPVELNRFEAGAEDCKVRLAWTAESEANFSHYELQRSSNGISFRTIKSIQAVSRDQTPTYQYLDEATGKINYYRLKMVDLDGRIDYSKTLNVNVNCYDDKDMIIFPNPAIHEQHTVLSVKLFSQNEETTLLIIDLMGRTIKKMLLPTSKEWNVIRIDISDLAAGAYFIQHQRNDGTRKVKKIVLQK